jgi:hypothetical protein
MRRRDVLTALPLMALAGGAGMAVDPLSDVVRRTLRRYELRYGEADFDACEFEGAQRDDAALPHNFHIGGVGGTPTHAFTIVKSSKGEFLLQEGEQVLFRIGEPFEVTPSRAAAINPVRQSSADQRAVAQAYMILRGIPLTRGLVGGPGESGAVGELRTAAAAQKWHKFLYPTAKLESLGGSFGTVNSYDSAGYTFGAFQFAAHTADDNLALLMARLLSLPNNEPNTYFPDLALDPAGRIVRRADGALLSAPRPANGGANTPRCWDRARNATLFNTYFNPDPYSVGHRELEVTARLQHWMMTSQAARQAQVEAMKTKIRDFFQLSRLRDARSVYENSWKCAIAAFDTYHNRGTPPPHSVRIDRAEERNLRELLKQSAREDALRTALSELDETMTDWREFGPALLAGA